MEGGHMYVFSGWIWSLIFWFVVWVVVSIIYGLKVLYFENLQEMKNDAIEN